MVLISTSTRRTRVVQRNKGNNTSIKILNRRRRNGISRKVLRRCFILLVIGSTIVVNIVHHAAIRRTRLDEDSNGAKRLQVDAAGGGDDGVAGAGGLSTSKSKVRQRGLLSSSESGLNSITSTSATRSGRKNQITQDGSIPVFSTKREDNSDKPCALLFFGLVKDFKDLALPAIQKNIIAPNPHCDIFLHTYDLDQVPMNERNTETNRAFIDPKEAYLLTSPDRVHIESVESFETRRMVFLEHSRIHHHRHSWGLCCLSHDNMIKQWHSINGAWELMRHYEEQILEKLRKDKDSKDHPESHYYQQVGLFRADVYQVNPIDIFDAHAAVPNFANNGGCNDRLFYGSYRNAALWADRFGFAPIFEEKYMFRQTFWTKFLLKQLHWGRGGDGYHSEFILGNLMEHYDVNPKKVNACLWRIRNGKRLQVTDCGSDGMMDEFQKYSPLHGYIYAPEGYIRDKRVQKGKWQWAGHWSVVWDDTVRQDIGDDIDVDALKINMNANVHSNINTTSALSHNKSSPSVPTPAVFVLGMFQSGGPLLTGLLAEGYGFQVGSNTSITDHFELKSMSSQNDAFLWAHGLSWNADVDKYTNDRSWGLIQNETMPTACGAVSLAQMHSRAKLPWVVHDPRLSITLQTWLPLLESKPKVMHIYRNPLEVAWLLKEEYGFELGRGLILWILYNKYAVQNSASNDICRVTISNDALLTNPLSELDRIVHELSTKCGQPTSPVKLNQDILNSFMEKHGSSFKNMPMQPLTLAKGNTNTGDCKVYEYQPRTGAEGFVEASLYSKANKIYCDLERGIAYGTDYIWPELTESEKGLHLQSDQSLDIERRLRQRYHSCTGTNHTLTDDVTR